MLGDQQHGFRCAVEWHIEAQGTAVMHGSGQCSNFEGWPLQPALCRQATACNAATTSALNVLRKTLNL